MPREVWYQASAADLWASSIKDVERLVEGYYAASAAAGSWSVIPATVTARSSRTSCARAGMVLRFMPGRCTPTGQELSREDGFTLNGRKCTPRLSIERVEYGLRVSNESGQPDKFRGERGGGCIEASLIESGGESLPQRQR